MNLRLLGVLWVALWASIASAAEPTLVRIAIVDNSASMRGERSAVVRKELTQLASQLPPSPQYPLILVVFDDKADAPQLFTERATADAAIARLTGMGGGTRIASGLNRAAEYLTGRSAAQVVLLLYTDGEDSYADELRAAEDRLDQQFGDRRKQGLHQSVYVKRWGNANAALVQKFIDSGNADVIDAGELSVTPLLFDPAVAVVRVTRDAADPRELHVLLAPTVRLSDKLRVGSTPTFRFRCLRQGLNTPAEITIPHGGPPQNLSVHCRPTSAEEAARTLVLPFEVNLQLGKAGTTTTLALPLLLTTRIDVPIGLPEWSIAYQATAAIRDVQAPAWTEPAAGRISLALTVAMTFKAATPLVSDTACRWRLAPLDGQRITGGSPEFIVSKPDTYLLPLTIETGIGPGAKHFHVKFRCESVDSTPHRFTPAALIVEKMDVPAPPPVTCSITGIVTAAGKARWIDVAQELAEFDVGVTFDTTGAVMPKERLAVLYTTPIRHLDFVPDNQLAVGRSHRTLRIRARLAANRPTDLSLLLEAPTASTAIRYVVGPPLAFRVAGPAPVLLVACIRGRPQTRLELTVSDLATATTFPLLVTPWGLDRTAMPTPLEARLTTTDPRRKPIPDRIPLYQAGSVACALPRDSDASFFVDQVFDVPFVLQPDRPTSALSPSTLVLRVTREAPFRRLLFRLSVAIAVLVLVGTLLVLYVRLRRSEPLRFEAARSDRTAK